MKCTERLPGICYIYDVYINICTYSCSRLWAELSIVTGRIVQPVFLILCSSINRIEPAGFSRFIPTLPVVVSLERLCPEKKRQRPYETAIFYGFFIRCTREERFFTVSRTGISPEP